MENGDKLNENDEGKEMNDEIGGKDVVLVSESEMRSIPSTDSVNNNDSLVVEYDTSTCSGDNVYDIFENE